MLDHLIAYLRATLTASRATHHPWPTSSTACATTWS